MLVFSSQLEFGEAVIPIALAQTALKSASSVLVSSFRLSDGQKLMVSWLGGKIVKVVGTATPVKANSNLGLVFVGVYYGSLERPAGTPAVCLSISKLSVCRLSPFYARQLLPGDYTVFACNNTLNLDFDVVVTGAARIYR